MRKTHQPFWFVAAVLCGVMLIVGISRMNDAPEIVPWRTDFLAARNESASSNKPIFAYFTASWCGPCQSLKHTTWADANVAKALQAYVPVEIDIDTHQDLAARYAPEAVPTFVVLDRDGAATKTESGVLSPDEFISWLDSPRTIESSGEGVTRSLSNLGGRSLQSSRENN
jgi:thioredoxin-like negative regulator of GroEL